MKIDDVLYKRGTIEVTFDEALTLHTDINRIYFISDMLKSQGGMMNEMGIRLKIIGDRLNTVIMDRLDEADFENERRNSNVSK